MNNYTLMAIAERIQGKIVCIENEIHDMNIAGAEEWTESSGISLDDFNERMECLNAKAGRYSEAFEVIKDLAFEDLAEAFLHIEHGGFHYDLPF